MFVAMVVYLLSRTSHSAVVEDEVLLQTHFLREATVVGVTDFESDHDSAW